MEKVIQPRTVERRRVLNGCEYQVTSFFKEEARETAEQKIIRLVKQCVSAGINNTEAAVSRSN